jgi:hypothetical protein
MRRARFLALARHGAQTHRAVAGFAPHEPAQRIRTRRLPAAASLGRDFQLSLHGGEDFNINDGFVFAFKDLVVIWHSACVQRAAQQTAQFRLTDGHAKRVNKERNHCRADQSLLYAAWDVAGHVRLASHVQVAVWRIRRR